MVDTTTRIISAYFNRTVAVIPTVGLAVSMQIFLSCSADKNTAISEDKFPVMHPIKMDTVFIQEYVADIQSTQNVELRSRVGGFLEQIHVDEGQTVKAGQLLFSISSQVFRDDLKKANAVLKSAEAELKVAEVELKSTRRLVEKNIVAQTELEMAEAKLQAIEARIEEARSAVSTAQLNLSFTSIKAPFAGVINRIPNKAGSLIDEGSLLTTISDVNEMFAYFNVSELEYLDYTRQLGGGVNKDVMLVTADNKVYDQKGEIETVESEIDKSTGTLAFRARFANPSRLLKHGASGKVLLHTELKDVLLVPQKSTFEIQENLYVYAVNKDNVVEMRSFVPRLRLPHLYVVQSGLSPDDNFIFEGLQKVKEGDRIIPQAVTFDTLSAPIAQK